MPTRTNQNEVTFKEDKLNLLLDLSSKSLTLLIASYVFLSNICEVSFLPSLVIQLARCSLNHSLCASQPYVIRDKKCQTLSRAVIKARVDAPILLPPSSPLIRKSPTVSRSRRG
jgi:hypothetical protein